MSHQTGIRSNEELRAHIVKARDVKSTVRLLKVKINQQTEEIEFSEDRPIVDDWKADFRQYIDKVIVKDEPCYIFYRLDNINDLGFNDWAFILYLPSNSGVRNKMLYASTKLTLKNDFGNGIRFDYLAENIEDISFESFTKWMLQKVPKMQEKGDDELPMFSLALAQNSDVLTAVEDERRKIKSLEFAESMEKNNKNLTNFQFPIHQDAINALLDFRDGRIIYLKMKVNVANEEILLVDRKNKAEHPKCAALYDVMSDQGKDEVLVFKDSATNTETGFYILAFNHFDPNHVIITKNIFVFVMSSEQSSIKERISHSACLHSLYDSIVNRINIPIDKRIEVGEIADVTVSLISQKLYPQLDNVKVDDFNGGQQLKFSKPKPPNSRRGLIK